MLYKRICYIKHLACRKTESHDFEDNLVTRKNMLSEKLCDHYFVNIAYLHMCRGKILDKYTKTLMLVFSG